MDTLGRPNKFHLTGAHELRYAISKSANERGDTVSNFRVTFLDHLSVNIVTGK